jgi:molybdate transport system ATP-binding protein
MLEARLRGSVGALELDVELDAPHGTLVIVGPNGAGKSSLLRMVLGALEPAAGRVAVNGRVLFDSKAGVNLRVENRYLGYVPQSYALFPHLNVLENVEFVMRCRAGDEHPLGLRERATAVLEKLALGPLAERSTHTLSGGEKQRVALARALAAEPHALLLDEPLHALDPGARREVRRFLRSYLERLELPSIVVTHDSRDVAALADRVAVLERGQVSQTGTWAELCAAPATPFVEELATR